MVNNKESKTNIINEKVKDYKTYSKKLKEVIAQLDSFYYYQGNCMKILHIVDNKALKFSLNSKCIQKTEIAELINITDSNYFKMSKYID